MIRLIGLNEIRLKTERFIDSGFGTPAGDHVFFVEVGPRDDYERVHWRRAIRLTEKQEKETAGAIFRNPAEEIILYGDVSRLRLFEAARSIEAQGFFNVYVSTIGKSEWLDEYLWRQSSLVPADHFTVEAELGSATHLNKRNESLPRAA